MGQMVVTHTKLSKESRMETIKVGTMMRHTTSFTATSRMLAMLADATMTGADVAAKLPGLL